MKLSSFLFISLLGAAPLHAGTRLFTYEIQVESVDAVYSDASVYMPATPAAVGDIITGTLLLDDSIPDSDPSLTLGLYGNSFSGPNNEFTFLGQTYTGYNSNETGLGVSVRDNESVNLAFFGQTFDGDSFHLSTAYSSGGIGGSSNNRVLQFILNQSAGSWLSSDGLPTEFPAFDPLAFIGTLKYTEFLAERVAPFGDVESRDMTITGRFISLTPVPEPGMISFSALILGTILMRRRVK